MEFKVNGESIFESISEAARIAGGSHSAAGKLVMIEAHSGGLSVSSGNGDRSVIFEHPLINCRDSGLDILEYGKLAADGRMLSEVIRKIPGRLSIKASTSHKILINSMDKQISAAIAGFPLDQFPDRAHVEFPYIYPLEASDLAAGLRNTAASAAKTSSRPILEGINLAFDENGLTFTATDSSRLAMWKADGSAGFSQSFTLPARNAAELLKLIGKSPSGEAAIYISDSQAVFATSTFRFCSSLLTGRFPSSEKLKPEGCKTELVINRKHLLQGVKRTMIFAGEKRSSLVSIQAKDENSITISSPVSEMGMIEEVQELQSIRGETEASAVINGSYLADALIGTESEYIKIRLYGTMKPILISSPGEANYFHLISPVRTASGMFLGKGQVQNQD
ncbi:DNA polymerase III subunit beta [Bacillus infantis]|uniref:DNA polymerase III subunit beta n=1 Tax=Bacillus TaxID=1386 RepID=UPI001CD4BF45|nr:MULTISPECIES: DNA polymerase III subunit beta [Bacillus]MCA1034887.1 DNA polymerase III subunit beta [Bacillus infantis]MDT0158838.1 DNA polymerase III subunit beta [Bacillus sp. AG4(2022)]